MPYQEATSEMQESHTGARFLTIHPRKPFGAAEIHYMRTALRALKLLGPDGQCSLSVTAQSDDTLVSACIDLGDSAVVPDLTFQTLADGSRPMMLCTVGLHAEAAARIRETLGGIGLCKFAEEVQS